PLISNSILTGRPTRACLSVELACFPRPEHPIAAWNLSFPAFLALPLCGWESSPQFRWFSSEKSKSYGGLPRRPSAGHTWYWPRLLVAFLSVLRRRCSYYWQHDCSSVSLLPRTWDQDFWRYWQ